jgi:2-oxoisovalerate dehydrogenase E1 component alpha subunit
MSEKIVGIIDEKGKVCSGAVVPEIGRDDLIRLYRAMLLNRRVDERMLMLQRQGRISFYVGAAGEEGAIIGSAFAMQDQEWLIPCYREAGAAFLRGYSLRDFTNQLFGNCEDKIKGRQMPCHWASRELRLASVSSPVGSQIPHANGFGLAAKFLGRKEAALVYFGDGATSEGDFHVACNMAGVFKAPVVFFCRNNQWAISVPAEVQTASETFAMKARAYGIEEVQVDGNDVLAVYQVTAQAAEKARKGDGPTLIEAVTYRQGAHTTSDDPRAYRSDDEVEVWKGKDPVERFRKFLVDQGHWSADQDAKLEEELNEEIHTAVREAETLGPPDIETVFEDVFEEMPWHLREQLEELYKTLDSEVE